jgi:hypothetical protein
MDRPAIAQDRFKNFSSDLFDRFSGDLDFNSRHIYSLRVLVVGMASKIWLAWQADLVCLTDSNS